MNNEYLLYLQEIEDTSWVVELISEQFDDAMNMMTQNSVIYGGAVRDCLAGKDLIGDLDIAVPYSESSPILSRFTKNPKWVRDVDKIVKQRDNSYYKHFGHKLSSHGGPSRNREARPDVQIVTFRTLGNKRVQIIILRDTGDDPFQTVATMVKQVDIVCCGVILTNDNKVFEVVPNAYEDCKNKVLRLNNIGYVRDVARFKSRVEKLSERGWTSEIDTDKVARIVNKKLKHKDIRTNPLRKVNRRRDREAPDFHTGSNQDGDDEKQRHGYALVHSPLSAKYHQVAKFSYAEGKDVITTSCYNYKLSNSDMQQLESVDLMLRTLHAMAKECKIDIIVKEAYNGMMFITKNKYDCEQVCIRLFGQKDYGKRFPLPNSQWANIGKPISPKKKETKISHYTNLPNDGEVSADKKVVVGKKEASDEYATVERCFNYSRGLHLSDASDKYTYSLTKTEVARAGGRPLMLARLERIARSYELDIDLTCRHGSVSITTRNSQIGHHVFKLLMIKVNIPGNPDEHVNVSIHLEGT